MAAKKDARTAIRFMFTPEGFIPDVSSMNSEKEWQEAAR